MDEKAERNRQRQAKTNQENAWQTGIGSQWRVSTGETRSIANFKQRFCLKGSILFSGCLDSPHIYVVLDFGALVEGFLLEYGLSFLGFCSKYQGRNTLSCRVGVLLD